MNFSVCKGILAALFLIVLASGCATAPKSYDYTAFREAKPRSIVVLPPLNSSPDVKATYSMLAQMSYPLAESGYYVLPVSLVDAAFKENGLSNAAEVHAVPTAKLREIFGADAALYVEVKEYGSSYRIISSETAVAAEARLVDLRTGQTLWTGSARSSSAENNNNNNNGLAGMLIGALINQIANSVSDKSHTYAGITSQRLLTAGGGQGRLLYGPRNAKYGQD
ncbi:DUF799 domain-containing protein [Chitinimonas sp.]|uniref:DUF799 domain-containing protein n=1 Tax=Chitinimonas sp. TaxID=1934313 RepID=UPI002F92CD33